MTKAKTTRRALFSSVIALFLCFSMLLGTTFAWFTDSVTSSGNIIQSGTLDVSLEHADNPLGKDEAGWVDASTGAIFNYDKWEPGYTVVKYVKVENEGTLDLKFVLSIVPNSDDAVIYDLADVIEVYMVDGAVAVERAALKTDSTAYVGTLSSLIEDADGAARGVLYADDADKAGKVYEIYTIALKMSETAGNEYQDLSVGGGFAVQLLATQLASESDSFDNKYDNGATFPEVAIGNVTKTEGNGAGVKTEDDSVAIDIPAAAPAGNYTIEVTDKQETTDAEGKTTVSMDIVLKCNGQKVQPDGVTAYTVSVYVGEGKIILAATHNGNNIADYDYDSTSGILSFTTTSFSPFAFTFEADPAYGKVAKVGDTYYENFADALAAANDGDTVVIVNDVTGLSANINKAITLDLGGKTVTDAYIIIISADVAIQNGSIKNVNEPYPLVVQNGGLLTVNNVDIEASKSDRAIWVRGGSKLVFNSGSILATKGENNTKTNLIAAIYTDTNTDVIINGGTITVDTPDNKAVGIFGNYTNANVTVNGGKISTSGKNYSYGINVDGDITVTDGEIVTNEKRYGYSSGIAYGYNYALVSATGDVTVTGGTITTNGYSGYIVSVGRTYSANEITVSISGGTFKNVLTEIDKTQGGHKAPVIICEGNAYAVSASITGGSFSGFSADVLKETHADTTISISGGTFDLALSGGIADGCQLKDNGNGTWTVG